MSTHDDLSDLGDALRAATTIDLAEQHRAGEARTAPRRRRTRSRVLAGGSLGLAGIGAGLVLAFSGSTAPPAFAITQNSDGVLVHLNYLSGQNLPQVNQKLAQMGTGESISIDMAKGAASTAGPVACAPTSAANGPKVSVVVGQSGTETIAAGQSAGNTAEGSFHLASCTTYDGDGGSGSTGAGNTGAGSSPSSIIAKPKSS